MGKILPLLLAAAIVFGAIVFDEAAFAEVPDWTGGVPTVRDVSLADGRDRPICPTYFTQTMVKNAEGPQELCVMPGDLMNFGTYFEGGNTPRAAVMFPLDDTYHRLDGVCAYMWGCLYAGETDTLITVHSEHITRVMTFYSNASQRVSRVFDSVEGKMMTVFDAGNPSFMLTDLSGRKLSVGAMTVSGDGEWLAAELRSLGLVLVNLKDFSVRRLTASGPPYGIGRDPMIHLAVSNGGRFVVQVGENAGFMLIGTGGDCGEPLRTEVRDNFPVSVMPCEAVPFSIGDTFPGFRFAVNPRFSKDGGLLQLMVAAVSQPARQVVLSAPGLHPLARYDYLALGDSFTSGEGETDKEYLEEPLERAACHVSVRSYPYLVGVSLGLPEGSVKNRACAGARMADLVGKGDSQLQALENARTITVGIGGNDAGFMTKLRACAQPDTCEWVQAPGRWQTAKEIQRLHDRLVSLYRWLGSVSEKSNFYAVGYPLAVTPSGSCEDLTGFLLNEAERKFMYEGLVYLNQVIRSAAESAGIGFIDLEEAFRDRELCSGAIPVAMNGLRIGDDIGLLKQFPHLKIIGSESFHPTPFGHELMAAGIVSEHPDLFTSSRCIRCEHPKSAPEPGGYWLEEGQEEVHSQRSFDLTDALSLKPADELNIIIPAGTLRAFSPVKVELHSYPYALGDVMTNESGGLDASFKIPAGVSGGYHTIHVYGESRGLEKVDLYQEVLVETVNETDEREENSENFHVLSFSAPRQLESDVLSEMDSGVSTPNTAESTLPIFNYAWIGWIPVIILIIGAVIVLGAHFVFRDRGG